MGVQVGGGHTHGQWDVAVGGGMWLWAVGCGHGS